MSEKIKGCRPTGNQYENEGHMMMPNGVRISGAVYDMMCEMGLSDEDAVDWDSVIAALFDRELSRY